MELELELDQLKREIKKKLKVSIAVGVTVAPVAELVVRGINDKAQLVREQAVRIDFGQWAPSADIWLRIPFGKKPIDPGTYEINATWAIDGFVLGRLKLLSQLVAIEGA